MQVNPEQVAENLAKSGAYIPSVRPGKQTETYLDKALSRITVLGALALSAIDCSPASDASHLASAADVHGSGSAPE